MIELRRIDTHPNKRSIRKFAATLLLGLPISGLTLSGVSYFLKESLSLTPLYVFSSIALVVFGISFLSERSGRAIHLAWHFFSASIEWFISLISLAFMYYVIIVPVGWIMKVVRRPSPIKGINRKQLSYWVDNEKKRDLSSHFRQF